MLVLEKSVPSKSEFTILFLTVENFESLHNGGDCFIDLICKE
jgi:hypothetical protein